MNAATLAIYGGLGALTFFLIIFLQQVGGYSAIGAGVAFVPVTLVMFFLSRRFGALSMRIGPRLPMTFGPLIGAAGLFLLRGVDVEPGLRDRGAAGVLLFALGLSMTVAPLTATVLSSVPQTHAGVASGVNNAVARIAGLLAIAVVGAVVSSNFAVIAAATSCPRRHSPRHAPSRSSRTCRKACHRVSAPRPSGADRRRRRRLPSRPDALRSAGRSRRRDLSRRRSQQA